MPGAPGFLLDASFLKLSAVHHKSDSFLSLMWIVVQAFYRASAAAEAASQKEWDAAVTIQRYWRGHAVRNWATHARTSARLIEATYMEWKKRKTEREAMVRAYNERRYNAYHGGATKLQALWRGYRSRTDIFDFRSRARYAFCFVTYRCDTLDMFSFFVARMDTHIDATTFTCRTILFFVSSRSALTHDSRQLMLTFACSTRCCGPQIPLGARKRCVDHDSKDDQLS